MKTRGIKASAKPEWHDTKGDDSSKKKRKADKTQDDDDDDNYSCFDGVDGEIANDPINLDFKIFNYCRQNGSFFRLKKTSTLALAFAVFESGTGQVEGAYRYRYAGEWLDRTKTPMDYNMENSMLTIEAWPRGCEVPKYCHNCK